MVGSLYSHNGRIAKINAVLRTVGFHPWPWQRAAIMRCEDNTQVGISVPRQNGKTEIELMLATISALRGDRVIIFTHNGDLMRDSIHRLTSVIGDMTSDGIIDNINEARNLNRIDFHSGGWILFKIRGSGIGVGLTADRLIFDESQKMSHDDIEDMLPLITTSHRRSAIMIGTPPNDDDIEKLGTETPFINQRRAGGDGWMEWGIGDYQPVHDPYTFEQACAANPAWQHIPNFRDVIAGEMATLEDRAFARQRLGAWTLPDTVAIHEPELTTSEIHNIMSVRGPALSTGLHAGLGIYPDSEHAYIVLSDGVSYEVVSEISVAGGDIGPLTDELVRLARRYTRVIIPGNMRGKAIGHALDSHGMQKKYELSDITATATSIADFCRKAHGGEIHVFNNELSAMALSSFWRGYDDRSQSTTVEAADPDARSAMLAIALAGGKNMVEAYKNARGFIIR